MEFSSPLHSGIKPRSPTLQACSSLPAELGGKPSELGGELVTTGPPPEIPEHGFYNLLCMLLWIITIVLHGALGAPKRLEWNLLEREETTFCLSSCSPQLPVQAGRSAAKRTSGESSLYSVVIW